MTTKRFHLGDVLTITTGRLVSLRHMEAVYDVLNWMTGDNLMTHQLPRAMDECQPHLLAQHPDLAGIEVPDFGDGPREQLEIAIADWLAEQVARFGEYREVAALADGDHTVIDPLEELAMNYPNIPVIGVVAPDTDDAE